MVAQPRAQSGSRGEPMCLRFAWNPVSVNAMYRAVRGRMVLSEAGREFKKVMSDALMAQETRMITGAVAITITFSFSDRRRRDVDNYAKSVLDSLKGVVFMDDSDITELHLFKELGAAADGMSVTVSAA
jgi:Holliday junction resolvase RusA-like endonuclease